MFDIKAIRQDFPLLNRPGPGGHVLVYLDSAATAQKPRVVIEAICEYYEQTNANIHRGVYELAQRATHQYEEARNKVKTFINARSEREVIFLRGATEAINLVATSFGRTAVGTGDNVVITAMEHHANLIPWQVLCQRQGAELRVIPMNKRGELELASLDRLLDERTKILAIVHISNSLGTINPVEELIAKAHKINIPVLVDGAQSIVHQPIDVQALDCDFFAFSGHKLFGPTGIGALYAKEALLEQMEPYQFGGEMIKSVTFAATQFNDLPHKFEAGTPNIEGAIALGKAIDYLEDIGMVNIEKYTDHLLQYATKRLREIEDLTIIGTASKKSSIISFTLGDIHAHDIGTILNEDGIAVRAGHHCTQPVMDYFGIPGTARASLSFYNTEAEIDALVGSLKRVKQYF